MLAHVAVALFLAVAPGAKPKAPTNVKCPVCKMDVDGKSPTATVKGQRYRTCSTHCAAELEKNPDRYLKPQDRK